MRRAVNLSYPRLLEWWTDDRADPGRLSLNNPDVQHLIAAISPESHVTDLGGVMSLNVRLDAAGLVLRVHQPFVSQRRLPATALPMQLVHGDVRLSNVCRTLEGRTLYLDFGFLAWRPRIHELAYALAFMLLALGGHQAPESFTWESVPRLVEEYEATANARLTPAERRALFPYTAAIPLYAAALDGFTEDPVGKLRSRLPFLHLSAWLLAHPTALLSEASGKR